VDKSTTLNIQKLNSIKMLILDVDGIMTDCRLWMDSNGQWKRIYSVRDGVGIKALIESGYQVAVITGATAEDVRSRVKMLGIQYLFEGALNKVPPFLELQKQSGIQPEEMAYMGDDHFDIPLLTAVQFSATVPDAMDEVIEAVQYITKRPAGNGAVREVCDFILKYGYYSPVKNGDLSLMKS
jgi:3-deoxy-D-manno-octulosonate 8-phosphate phosphatase (KDO 8-P phosphatase)